MGGRTKSGTSGRGRLRIVAGNWRSRLLDIAEVEGLRPTGERIRETLFNWLAPQLHGARCLDLFAGTGALGLEALSRGAHSVTFVERSAAAAKQLRRNIELLDAQGATVLQQDALEYLRDAAPGRYDIAFLDPPFAADLLGETCRLLDASGLLADGALVYLEQDRAVPLPQLPDSWRALKDKTAGKVRYLLVKTGA